MATDAERSCVCVGQNYLAVLCRQVAGIACVHRERGMSECLNELGRGRLVRVVALHAIGSRKGLSLVSLDQGCVLRVVTVQTQRRRSLGQVEIEFLFAALTDLVGHMAGFAAHIEGGMPTAFLRNIQSLRVAGEAEILIFVARCRFQQLKLVIGLVGIVALHAIANRGRVNRALQIRRIIVRMTGQTESLRGGRRQLDARDVLGDPYLVTTGASGSNR